MTMGEQTVAVPLILLTGFLGSGKTTLLNTMLRHGDMSGTAVLMNEIGAVGIDHNLVIGASDDILLLEGGCLCCQPQGSVGEGVSRLLSLEPAPRRIIVETSGAANPIPILESLSQHPAASTGFQFPRVVTVVDCVAGPATLEHHVEARFQLGAADVVAITKTDLASERDRVAVAEMIAATSPAATSIDTTGGKIPDGFIKILSQPVGMQRARSIEADLRPATIHGDTDFETIGLQFEGYLAAAAVQDWIDQVLDLYGNHLLRIKGILHLREFERPAVLQCVRDIVHPIEMLDARAGNVDHNSIVAIGWGMHPELLREALGWLVEQAVLDDR